jgi:tetraacyldisaccharide 4'-kinase
MSIFSQIYGAVVKRRNTAYDTGNYAPYHTVLPVFSVGNITTGGTGKTPMAQYLARVLIEQAVLPAIIGRGYKRRSSGQVIVCNGTTILATADTAGDELLLHAELLGVPVIADGDRKHAAESARQLNATALIMDDGFQHRRLHRDCDILLIDRATLTETKLLPSGRLREPLQSALRAHCIVCTGGVSIEELPADILTTNVVLAEAVSSLAPLYRLADRTLHECRRIHHQAHSIIPAEHATMFAVSGIAHPHRFRSALQEYGAQSVRVVGTIEYNDHARYTPRIVHDMCKQARACNAGAIITTEKDAVKLRSFLSVFESQKIPVYVAPLELSLVRGSEAFTLLCQTIVREFRSL